MKDIYLPWLFNDTPVLASIIDDKTRLQQVSSEFARRLGQTRKALAGRAVEELCTPASNRRLRESYRPMIRRTGKLFSVPIEFVLADGKTLELVASSLQIKDGGDGRQITLSIYEDLRATTHAVQRFRSFYHLSPTMLHTMDGDGRLLDVSEQWLRKLGYRREYVVGRNVRQFMSAATRAQLEDGELPLIRDDLEFTNHPRELVASDGKVLEVIMSARAERDDRGNVRRLYVASKDVTERNANERALREALEENSRLRRKLEHERDYLREKVNVSMNFGRIVGSSNVLRQLVSRIDAVAQTNASVLIVGESGTGKELVAHAIHAAGLRKDQPLVKVNCASIPAELFESEFFGHVKGAFTGAHRDRVGRFALANGGTIFLDEVGEIPLALQGKLLRVLQEKEFERIGDDTTQVVDVRVVAATNRDLAREVREGRFREDLYYRLSVFPVDVPPLRERGEDVVQIAAHLLRQIGQELGVTPPALTQMQADRLKSYSWPGNVRELRNRLERAVIMSRDGRLDLELPTVAAQDSPAPPVDPVVATIKDAPFYTESDMRELQRDNLLNALRHADWRVSGEGGAADLLGIRPTTLNGRIRSFGIERPAVQRGRPARTK